MDKLSLKRGKYKIMADLNITFRVHTVFLTFLLVQRWAVVVFAFCSDFGTESCSCSPRDLDCSSSMLNDIPVITDKTLISISFRMNDIKSITNEDFSDFNELETLDLSENLITYIDEHAFMNLEKLKSLILTENRLTRLEIGHFMQLISLEKLILSNNNDLTIDPCLLSQLPNLKYLAIDETNIEMVNTLITPTEDCQLLLSEDTVDVIDMFDNVKSITQLFVGFNGTSSDTSVLESFTSLDYLYMKAFPAESFTGPDIDELPNLETLILDSIDVFPKNFLVSETLQELHVENSLFPCLPAEAFSKLPSLRIVGFLRNALRAIDPNAFRNADHLQLINLSFNKLLFFLPGSLDGLGNAMFFPILVLSGNEWICDCRLEWFQEFLSSDSRISRNGQPLNSLLLCHSPVHLAGTSLLHVDFDFCAGEDNTQDSYEDYDDEVQYMCLTGQENPPVVSKMPSQTNAPSSTFNLPTIVGMVAMVILIISIVLLSIAIVVVYKRNKRIRKERISKASKRACSRRSQFPVPRQIRRESVYDDTGGTDQEGRIYDRPPTATEEGDFHMQNLKTISENVADYDEVPLRTPYSFVTMNR